jgi:hypothetical protein
LPKARFVAVFVDEVFVDEVFVDEVFAKLNLNLFFCVLFMQNHQNWNLKQTFFHDKQD